MIMWCYDLRLHSHQKTKGKSFFTNTLSFIIILISWNCCTLTAQLRKNQKPAIGFEHFLVVISMYCGTYLKFYLEKSFTVYDSCLYPQLYPQASLSLATKFWSYLTSSEVKLVEPDRKEEKHVCVEAYLGEDVRSIRDDILSGEASIILHKKVLAVFYSLEKAKKEILDKTYNSLAVAVLPVKGIHLAQVRKPLINAFLVYMHGNYSR